jgi:hypothetical protein
MPSGKVGTAGKTKEVAGAPENPAGEETPLSRDIETGTETGSSLKAMVPPRLSREEAWQLLERYRVEEEGRHRPWRGKRGSRPGPAAEKDW